MKTTDEHPHGESNKPNLRAFAAAFDRRFTAFLTPSAYMPADVPAELLEAMRYAALAPGKRLRPYLATRCCTLAGGEVDQAWYVGAAIECIHAFSLIHDDLPAMDDDDLRRGQPTCHKKFGEAIAILAGDALSMLAFEILTTHAPDPAMAGRMVALLAEGGGWSGMIGGQAADIAGELQPASISLTEYIHARKTARLFEAACKLGAMAGGGSTKAINKLGAFGALLGRAFQIADDLLDITASAEQMGKATGKDAKTGKQTFPRCVGTEASRETARELAAGASAHLGAFGAEADDLRNLAAYVVDRDY